MQTDRKICAYRYLLGSMGDLHKFFSRKENNATDDRTPTSQDGLVSSWKSFAHSIKSGKYLENHLRYCYLNGNVNRWMNAKRIFCFSYWVLGYKNIRYSWFRQVHKMFCQLHGVKNPPPPYTFVDIPINNILWNSQHSKIRDKGIHLFQIHLYLM